jgi:hypothetical protein
MNPSIHDPDVVTLAECFASRAAHDEHCRREPFLGFWDRLHDLCLAGRFENIYAEHVEPDSADFTRRDWGAATGRRTSGAPAAPAA